MAQPVQQRPAAPLRNPWLILSLLVLSIFINYIDRSNLSVAAPDLAAELRIGPADLGLLLSGFFWTYALWQFPAGWLVDRFNVYVVYGTGFLLWSAATALTGFAHGFAMLFALRLLLGIGESVAYPAYSRILASGFPERHRGICNAVIDAGSKLGPALGTLFGGLIVAHAGWRSLFFLLGGGALLWLVPWFLSIPRGHEVAAHASLHAGGPSFLAIAKQRAAWGTFLGLFAVNWAWYFLLTWLPSYLRIARHVTPDEMAVLGSLPFWLIAASTVTSGWLSDHWIAGGASPSKVRRRFAATGLITMGVLIAPVPLIHDNRAAITLLVVASGALGLCTSNLWAITQSIAGPRAAGKWTGLQNAIGNLAGAFGPWLTGKLVEQTGSFVSAFALISIVLAAGAYGFAGIVRSLKPVEWPE